jgi:hypothetical protein
MVSGLALYLMMAILDLLTLKLLLVYTKCMSSTRSTNVSAMVNHAVVRELILNAMKFVDDHHQKLMCKPTSVYEGNLQSRKMTGECTSQTYGNQYRQICKKNPITLQEFETDNKALEKITNQEITTPIERQQSDAKR